MPNRCEHGCGQFVSEGKQYVWGHQWIGRKHAEKTKEKMSKATSGKNHPMFGKHLSEKTKSKLSKKFLGKNSPVWGKHHSKETKEKMRLAWTEERKKNVPSGEESPLFGKQLLKKVKENMSKAWTNERRLQKATMCIERNKKTCRVSLFEKELIELFRTNRLPYKFVGDFQLIIGGKCPDFVHLTKKIVVEAYEDYWKDEDYVPKRRAHFRKFGYKCIFIHYHDSREKIVKRVKTFK